MYYSPHMQQARDIPVLIPAYKPGPQLIELIDTLLQDGFQNIVVVNDGSGAESEHVFNSLGHRPQIHIVSHAVNLGKGAALKTGMNFVLVHLPTCIGIVTADADGQHHPTDILTVAAGLCERPDALILGVRRFDGGVPLRSRVGNTLTRIFLRYILGQRLTDTQTGLRGIPHSFISHLLRVPSSGYEFELDMLIACKYQSRAIIERAIRTIYIENNKSSHFHPLFDSMRIYFLLFRFSVLSFLTAVLDNLVFALVFLMTGMIGQSQILSRLVAMTFNYAGARTTVFHSRQSHTAVLPKYIALVCFNGILSYALINFIHMRFEMEVMHAKILAECLLFVANFAIQRDFVFTIRPTANATDWDSYYKNVPFTAKLTRRYTASVLIKMIKRYCKPQTLTRPKILEIGGANSCFLDRIISECDPSCYDIVDTNGYGLSLLSKRATHYDIVRLHQQSVLELSIQTEADCVFSVGLVEHFDRESTRKAVLAHFDILGPEGIIIITFPTPTLIYRIARSTLELLGLWKFPDERPLHCTEVVSVINEIGEVLQEKTLWPLVLTQHMVIARKRVLISGDGTPRVSLK